MTEARDWALKECNQLGSECRVSEEYEGNYEINDECKPILAKWQQLRGRGAFAGGKTGACGYSYEYSSRSEADSRAIKECETNKGVNCKILYQK